MAIRGIRQFLINGEIVGVPEENVEQFLALTQDKGVEEAPASQMRYFMGDDGKTFAVNDEGARQMVQAARYGGFGVSRSMFKNAGLTEDYGSTADERLAFANQLGQFYPDEQVDGLGAPVKKNIGDAVMPAARFVGNVAAQTGKNLAFAPDSQWGEWLDEDGKSAGANVVKNAIRGANDFANKATQAAVSIPSNVNRLSSRLVEAGERAVGAEPTASEWMRNQSDIAEQRVANALPTDTAERGNDFVDKAGDFVANTLTTVGKFAIPGAAAVDISEGAAETYYNTYQRALKAGHKATDAAILAATQSGIGATEGIILAKAAAGAKNASGFLGNLKGMAASSAEVGAKMGAAAGARDIYEQALDDPTGQVPYDPMQTAAETGKSFGEGAAFDAIAKGVHLLDRTPARQAALERTVAKNINDSRQIPTDSGVAPTVEPLPPAPKPTAIQVPVKDGKGKVRMEPLLLPAPTAESMLPNPNQMAMRPGVMDVMKPQGEQGLLPPPVETRAQTNENAPRSVPTDSKPITPVEPTASRETPPATPTTPHGVNDGIRQFADAYSKGDRKGMAAAQKSLSEAWKVENDYLTLTPDEMGAITEKMPEAARGKFLEMANQWRETKETPPPVAEKPAEKPAKPTTAAEFDPVEYKNWLAKQGKRDTNKMRSQFLTTKRAAPTAEPIAEPQKPVADEVKEPVVAKMKPPAVSPAVAEKPDGTAAYKRLSPSLRALTPKQMRAKASELEAHNARPEVAADLRAAADQIEANGKLSAKAEPAVETPIAEKPTEKPAKPSKPVPETEAQFEARLAKEKAAAKDEGASEADIAEAERIQRLLRETGDEDARPLKDILYAKQGIDAKIEARRDDPEVVAWAKKQGRHIQNGKVDYDVVRGYDRDQATRAGKLVKNLFPDMEIKISKYPPELGGEKKSQDLPLLSPSGETLGTFSPKTKKVILYPGANPAVVAHEIGWHAVRDWAMRSTRAGNADAKKVYDKMREVEINAPDAIKDIVRKLYNGQTKSNIMNEFGAWTFMGRGGNELKAAIKTRADQVWYAKAITAVKDAWRTFLTKTEWGNKVDFSGVENMTIDEFQDWLGKTLTSGKTIGKILPKTNEVRMDKASSLEKHLTSTYDKNTPIKNIEKEIAKKTGVKIKAEDSPSAALQLKHGMDDASRISTDNVIKAYQKKLAETGLNNADVMNLMQYRAAEGRDAKIDAKNKAEIAKPFDLSINDMQTKRIDAAAKLAGVQAKLATARADLSAAQARNDSAAITDANRRIGQHTRWADYWKQTDTKLADDIAKATAKRDQKLAAYKTVNGSAVNLDEARKIIAEIDNGPKAKEFHELEAMVREIIDATIEGRVKNGLLSRAEADKLKAEEPFYVPFKSPVDPTTGEYIGRGSLKDAEYRQAEGRQTSAGDIIGHILTDYENAMFRANENSPRVKLAALVRANPELGTVTKLEADSKITERKTKDGSRIPDMGDPNVVLFKQNGDSYVIRLNGDRGAQVAAAFTGRNLSRIPGKVQGLARMWANTATSWVPTFITRNLIKDQPDVIFGLMGDYGLVKGGIMGAGYLGKQATGLSTVARFVTTGEIRTVKPNGKQDKIGAMFKEYVESGSLIAGGAAAEGYGEIANAFSQKEIQKIAKKAQKGGKSVSKAMGQHLLKSIRYMNELAEITTRFNVYRTVREAGKTPTEAALYSREITGDFNRKGNITPLTNTLRMFSNATLGGNVRNLAALSAKHGYKLALGLIVNGIAQAALEDFMNPDDDDKKLEKEGRGAGRDVSEYERKSALWLFRKGSNVSKYGMHAGPFSLLSYFGSCLYRVARGQMKASTMAKELGLTTAEVAANLTPFTSGMSFDAQDGKIGTAAKSMVATLMPSLAQPFIEMGTGVDYAGRHYKQQGNYPGDTSPLSEKGRFTTSPLAKSAARWLNEETGGNEGRPGGIDMYPEDLQKLTTGILKGVGTDVMNAVDTGLAIFNGKWDELETRNVPFARDFKKNIEDNSGRYFETLHAMNVDVGDVNKRKTSAERREFAKTRPWMKYDGEKYALDEFAKEYVKDAEKWRKMAQGKVLKGRGWVEAETPPTREQVQAYKAKMRRAQAKLLEKYATGHVKSGD